MSAAAFTQDVLRRDNGAYDKDVTEGLVNVYGAEKVVDRMRAQLQGIGEDDPLVTGEIFVRIGNAYSVLLRDVELQKCGIVRGLYAALYSSCLHYLKSSPISSHSELRRMIWNTMASVVRGSFNVHLIGRNGKFRTGSTPLRVYTALSLLLYGGAEFLAYGVSHLGPLITGDAEDDTHSCCREIVHEIRVFVQATNMEVPQHLIYTEAETERQKMLTALSLFRGEFRKVWWPTLRLLKEVLSKEGPAPSQKEMLREWQSLGDELGFSEWVESAEFQKRQSEAHKLAADFWAWVAFRYHSEKFSSKLRVCAGCGEVGYCSRECQKAHWKSGRQTRNRAFQLLRKTIVSARLL